MPNAEQPKFRDQESGNRAAATLSLQDIRDRIREHASEVEASEHGLPGQSRAFVEEILESLRELRPSIEELGKLRDDLMKTASRLGGPLCDKGGTTFARLVVVVEQERSKAAQTLEVMANTPFPQSFKFPRRNG